VIILDEPTSGLDVDSRRQIWELIKKVRKTRAIIMSTQHIEEADELANHVCVMSHGKIVVEDTPEKIKVKFGVGYTLIVEWENKNNRSFNQDRASLSPTKIPSTMSGMSGKESGNEEFIKQIDSIIYD
jgi:ABC-type multidrug transport system ATPase subunit